MKSLVAVLLASFVALASAKGVVEIDLGEIKIFVPPNFVNIPGRGIDTLVGKIQSFDERISIAYDIGDLAGVQTRPSRPGDDYKTIWYREGKTGNTPVLTTLHQYGDGRRILYVTFPKAGPAQFSIEAKDEEQARRLAALIISFQPQIKAGRRR